MAHHKLIWVVNRQQDIDISTILTGYQTTELPVNNKHGASCSNSFITNYQSCIIELKKNYHMQKNLNIHGIILKNGICKQYFFF